MPAQPSVPGSAHVVESNLHVVVGEELWLISPLGSVCFAVRNDSIHELLSGRNVSGSVVNELVHHFGLTALSAQALIDEWLNSSSHAVGYSELIRRSMPGITALEQHVGPIVTPTNVSPRIQHALRQPDVHSAAVAYTNAPVGRRAALSFALSLVIDDRELSAKRLTESRAAFLPLVGDSGLWSELATIDVPEQSEIPPTQIGTITSSLEPRKQVEFAKLAMRHQHGGKIIKSAAELGITASPDTPFAQLVAMVRLSGCDIGNSLLDDVKETAIDPYRVDVIRTPDQVYELGALARNCLAEREDHGWQWAVGTGEVELGAFYLHDELVAILALDTVSAVPIEFLGKENARVSNSVARDISAMLETVSPGHRVTSAVVDAFRDLANFEVATACEHCRHQP